MKKYLIPILFLIGISVWYFWPEKTLEERCLSKQCREDLEFVNSAYKKQWEEYYKKRTIVFNGDPQKGINKEKVKREFYRVDKVYIESATVTIPFSPNVNLQLRSLGGFAPEKNCVNLLIFRYCPSTFDERIAEMRKYFEEK